jgi:hypothetical protein
MPGSEATVRDPHFQARVAEGLGGLSSPDGPLETDLEVASRPISGQAYHLVPGTPLPFARKILKTRN